MEYDPSLNSYAIKGRISSDIIKSGGYKLSALEIERELLSLNDIQECAVLGIPDDDLGEVIAAVIVCRDAISENLTAKRLSTMLSQRLAQYKRPRLIKVLMLF